MTTANRPRLTPEQKASHLAMSFAALEDAPGVMPFDADRLDRWAATVASSGERHAAAFVLAVYNASAPWRVRRFDENRAAFAAWVRDPYTL